jgi:hypothetical protein
MLFIVLGLFVCVYRELLQCLQRRAGRGDGLYIDPVLLSVFSAGLNLIFFIVSSDFKQTSPLPQCAQSYVNQNFATAFDQAGISGPHVFGTVVFRC